MLDTICRLRQCRACKSVFHAVCTLEARRGEFEKVCNCGYPSAENVPQRIWRFRVVELLNHADTIRSQLRKALESLRAKSNTSVEAQQPASDLKLHLGCGEVYLEGYVNIDFSPNCHGVQTSAIADIYADIRDLWYPNNSVAEIRLHHLFEHFDRATALRLLIDWYGWLCPGGSLIIETPDFERCVQAWLRSRDVASKMRLLRHIFGSHEAAWAVHQDGWYQSKFDLYLRELGFLHIKYVHTEYRGLYNVTALARKAPPFKAPAEQRNAARRLLGLSLVDASDSEMRMLNVWTCAVTQGRAPRHITYDEETLVPGRNRPVNGDRGARD